MVQCCLVFEEKLNQMGIVIYLYIFQPKRNREDIELNPAKNEKFSLGWFCMLVSIM